VTLFMQLVGVPEEMLGGHETIADVGPACKLVAADIGLRRLGHGWRHPGSAGGADEESASAGPLLWTARASRAQDAHLWLRSADALGKAIPGAQRRTLAGQYPLLLEAKVLAPGC